MFFKIYDSLVNFNTDNHPSKFIEYSELKSRYFLYSKEEIQIDIPTFSVLQ